MHKALSTITAAAALVTVLLALGACTSTTPDDPRATPEAPIATATQPAPASASAQPAGPIDTATGGFTSFFDAGTTADDQVLILRDRGDNAAADLVQTIADQPTGMWLGEWTIDPAATVKSVSQRATEAEQISLFIVYNVPGRDCGLYSAGGTTEEHYLTWIQQIADGITPGSTTWFILEPDALPQLGDCEGQGDRVALLAGAARILDESGGKVFLDIGNSNWKTAQTMAERVATVGTEHLTGVATNTSNYNATEKEVAFGEAVAELTGLPFITDTSRNGNGATDDGQWCNPRGRALGERPFVFGDDGPLLAYVWAKVPGESDGQCNGGPAAGQWWQEIAEELARNA